MFARNEQDIYKIELFGDRIVEGKTVKMRDIHIWCYRQDIAYKTKFKYIKKYPVSANIWNFYSYGRFLIEKNLNMIE